MYRLKIFSVYNIKNGYTLYNELKSTVTAKRLLLHNHTVLVEFKSEKDSSKLQQIR